VRAGPPAPEPSKKGGYKKEREPEPADEKESQKKILGGKGHPEEMETLVQDIQEYGGFPVYGDKGKGKVDADQEQGEDPPQGGEPSGHIRRMQRYPGSVFSDGCDEIKVRKSSGPLEIR